MNNHGKEIDVMSDFDSEDEVGGYISYLEKTVANTYIVFDNVEQVRLALRDSFNKKQNEAN